MASSGQSREPTVLHESDCDLERWNDIVKGDVTWRTLISGDRTPTDGLTCGVAYLPVVESRTIKLHRHADVEIYYILEGNGLLSLSGTEHEVKAGSTVYVPGNVWHGLINAGDSPLRLFYVFPVDSFDKVEYVFPEGS